MPTPAELAEVTDWMQRRLAHESTSPEVLALLAGSGSRKKIRNVAKGRARNRRLRTRWTQTGSPASGASATGRVPETPPHPIRTP
ncbi:hypothetical protein ACIP3B_28865 [Streptomyces anulatus]